MGRKEQISARQFTIFIALYTMGDAILYLPGQFVMDAGRDAWIASIFSVIEMFSVVFLLTVLGKRYPGLTLLEYMEVILGKFFSKMLLTYFVGFSLLDVSILLMEVGDFMNSQIFPRTPTDVILLLFITIVVLAARLGPEATHRTSEIMFPFIVVLFLFMIIALSPRFDLNNIQPVMANGLFPVVKASRVLFGFFFDSVALLIFFPLVKQPNAATKSFYLGTAIGGAFIILISTAAVLVLGVDTISRHAFPAYMLGKKISIGNFVERIEIIFTVLWFTSLFFKTYLFFMGTTLGVAKLCGLKSNKIIALPIALVMVLLGRVMFPSRASFEEWSTIHWFSYSISFGVGIPVLLLLVDFFRKKRIKMRAK